MKWTAVNFSSSSKVVIPADVLEHNSMFSRKRAHYSHSPQKHVSLFIRRWKIIPIGVILGTCSTNRSAHAARRATERGKTDNTLFELRADDHDSASYIIRWGGIEVMASFKRTSSETVDAATGGRTLPVSKDYFALVKNCGNSSSRNRVQRKPPLHGGRTDAVAQSCPFGYHS